MFAWKALPYIDASNGGSVIAHASDSRQHRRHRFKNVDNVITGHTPLLPWSDLREYAEFSGDFVAFARSQVKAGKSVDKRRLNIDFPNDTRATRLRPARS